MMPALALKGGDGGGLAVGTIIILIIKRQLPNKNKRKRKSFHLLLAGVCKFKGEYLFCCDEACFYFDCLFKVLYWDKMES